MRVKTDKRKQRKPNHSFWKIPTKSNEMEKENKKENRKKKRGKQEKDMKGM